MSTNQTRPERPNHRSETRRDAGRKLKALYRNIGLKRADLATLCQVSERAVYRWEAGHTRVPLAVVKLLRLMTYQELPGRTWVGWSFGRDKLWSPEGHGFSGEDFAWLNLTARRSAMFGTLYRERQALLAQLKTLAAELSQAKVDLATAEGQRGLVELALRGALWDAQTAAQGPGRGFDQTLAQFAAAGRMGRDVLVTRPVCPSFGHFDDSAPGKPEAALAGLGGAL